MLRCLLNLSLNTRKSVVKAIEIIKAVIQPINMYSAVFQSMLFFPYTDREPKMLPIIAIENDIGTLTIDAKTLHIIDEA
jgi:hypothetical protein